MQKKKWLGPASLLVIAMLVVLAYTFFHELGHALAALIFGGQVTAFNINFFNLSAPHVSIVGQFLPWQDTIRAAAGAGLPVLVWSTLLFILPRRGNETLERLKLVGSAAIAGSLIPWVIIPLLDLFGLAPASDDVVSFLDSSRLPRLLVSTAALLLVALLLWLHHARTASWADMFRQLRQAAPLSPGAQRTLGTLAVVLAAGLLLAFAGGAMGSAPASAQPSARPPDGYRLAAEIELSQQDYLEEPVAGLRLDQPGSGGVYLFLRNVRTGQLNISLAGQDGFRQLILRADDYSSSSDSARYEDVLAPGEYSLLLTSLEGQGRLWIYTLQPGGE